MGTVFRGLTFDFKYLDDIINFSRSLDEHQLHLRRVFTLLEENGLVINAAKCVFATSSLEFLGHQVTTASLVPLPRHVDAIQDFPQPQDIKQLQRFLGLINFYRRFLLAIAGNLRPLTDALAGNPKKLS